MDISNQLRLILLLTGAVVFIAVYFFSRRRTAEAEVSHDEWTAPVRQSNEPEFIIDDSPLINEEELEVPAYIRKQKQEGRYEADEALTTVVLDDDHVIDEIVATQAFIDSVEREQKLHQPIASHARTDRFNVEEIQLDLVENEPFTQPALSADVDLPASIKEDTQSVPIVFDLQESNSFVIEEVTEEYPKIAAEDFHEDFAEDSFEKVSDDLRPESAIELEPALETKSPLKQSHEASALATPAQEVVVSRQAESAVKSVEKPTAKPAGVAARKIFSVRLVFPERIDGMRLLELLEGERMMHGKFGIFHRLNEGASVFSLASMVEPGSFDLQQMPEQYFPGVTLFMLLPGPLDGLIAFDQLMTCVRRMSHATQGVVQDERGNTLNAQLMNRLRDDVLDFQHLIGGVAH